MFDALFEKSGISLERLYTLCLVEKHGGITRAAAKAGPDNKTAKQSQFSRQVKELEAFFDVKILDRDVQPHQFTEEGKKLVKIAKQALENLDEFTRSCSNQPVRLTIGAGESLIQWLLMPHVDSIRNELTNASIGFMNRTTSEIVEGLHKGDFDLGLVRGSAITNQLSHFRLDSYGYRLFVPKRMRKKLGKSVSMSALKGIRLALLEGTGEFRTAVDELAAREKVKLDIELECSSSTQVAYAVRSLGYAGILPQFAEKILSEEKVTSHVLKGFDLTRELTLAWNTKRAESRPVIKQAASAFKKLIS